MLGYVPGTTEEQGLEEGWDEGERDTMEELCWLGLFVSTTEFFVWQLDNVSARCVDEISDNAEMKVIESG